MDTLKDKQWLESLHESGSAPWQVWDPDRVNGRALELAVSRMMLPLPLGAQATRGARARDRRPPG